MNNLIRSSDHHQPHHPISRPTTQQPPSAKSQDYQKSEKPHSSSHHFFSFLSFHYTLQRESVLVAAVAATGLAHTEFMPKDRQVVSCLSRQLSVGQSSIQDIPHFPCNLPTCQSYLYGKSQSRRFSVSRFIIPHFFSFLFFLSRLREGGDVIIVCLYCNRVSMCPCMYVLHIL